MSSVGKMFRADYDPDRRGFIDKPTVLVGEGGYGHSKEWVASNAPELFSKPNIDGGLIGGASLKAADFKGIIDAWKK